MSDIVKGRHSHARRHHYTPTYNSWCSMKKRCFYKNDQAFPRYGGRGITVCDRWLIFDNFLEDMGERPIGKTLDRVDNNGNYEPSNCRWATWNEQANNRKNKIITHSNGLTLKELSEAYGIQYDTLWYRLFRSEMSLKKALSTPVLRKQ